jgi:carboxymethylenebutenolidase
MRSSLASGTTVEVVRPEGATAGLVVVPDIMGLRPLFDDHVARLAAETGWAVGAFEVFPGQESMPLGERLGAMRVMDDARWVDDATATANLLEVDGPVGILGFCMGGMVAMKAVATGRFHRAAPFYGMIRNPADWGGGEGPNGDAMDALLANPGSAALVHAVVGTADAFTPPEHVAELEAAGGTAVRYEGAEHGFVHDPSRPTHRADDAADAWSRVLAWLTPSAL